MGATIKGFFEGIDDSEGDLKLAQQKVDLATNLIETRFKTFQSQLNLGIGPIEKIPGKYLICLRKIVSANISSGSKGNRDAISGIVDQFAKGDIAKGIVNVLYTTLDMILGTYSASYNQSQDYIVLTNLMGGLFRIDYLVIKQELLAVGTLKTQMTNVFGSYLVISSINKKEFDDDNVYRILVERQFADKKMRQKFVVIKMLKGEELSQNEMDIISGLKYDQGGQVKPGSVKASNQVQPQRVDGLKKTEILLQKNIKEFQEQIQKKMKKLNETQQELKDLQRKKGTVEQELQLTRSEIKRIEEDQQGQISNRTIFQQNQQLLQRNRLLEANLKSFSQRIDRLSRDQSGKEQVDE